MIQLCGRIGIYAIINLKNNIIYIGKSINLSLRFHDHLIKIVTNKSLYADIIKYTLNNFAFILLSSVAIDGIITLCPQIFDISWIMNISQQLTQLDINNILHGIEISCIAFFSGLGFKLYNRKYNYGGTINFSPYNINLLSGTCIPVTLIRLDGSESDRQFKSIRACCEFLKVTRHRIEWAVKKKNGVIDNKWQVIKNKKIPSLNMI